MIQVSSFSRPVLKPPVLSPVCQSLPSVQQSEHQLRNSIPKPLSHRNTWASSLALRAARAAFLWSIISLAWESSMGNFIYPFRFLLFLNPSMTEWNPTYLAHLVQLLLKFSNSQIVPDDEKKILSLSTLQCIVEVRRSCLIPLLEIDPKSNLISGSSESPSTLVCFNSSTSFFNIEAATSLDAWRFNRCLISSLRLTLGFLWVVLPSFSKENLVQAGVGKRSVDRRQLCLSSLNVPQKRVIHPSSSLLKIKIMWVPYLKKGILFFILIDLGHGHHLMTSLLLRVLVEVGHDLSQIFTKISEISKGLHKK